MGPGGKPRSGSLLKLRDLTLSKRSLGYFELRVDRFDVREGEFVAVLGESGCGKTTLMHFLGQLVSEDQLAERDEGELSCGELTFMEGAPEEKLVWYTVLSCAHCGESLRKDRLTNQFPERCPRCNRGAKLDEAGAREGQEMGSGLNSCTTLRPREAEELRRDWIGFALQKGELIPSMSLEDNIRLPLRLTGMPEDSARERARSVLQEMEMGKHLKSLPGELSGGQQQRGVFARAVAHQPYLVILDEPTSNLDGLNARSILSDLHNSLKEGGQGVVMVTHDEQNAKKFATRIDRMAVRPLDFEEVFSGVCRRTLGLSEMAFGVLCSLGRGRRAGGDAGSDVLWSSKLSWSCFAIPDETWRRCWDPKAGSPGSFWFGLTLALKDQVEAGRSSDWTSSKRDPEEICSAVSCLAHYAEDHRGSIWGKGGQVPASEEVVRWADERFVVEGRCPEELLREILSILDEGARALESLRGRYGDAWRQQGRLISSQELKEPAIASEGVVPAVGEPERPKVGAVMELAWRDAVGPLFARLKARRSLSRNERKSSGKGKLGASFFKRLVTNSVVVAALSSMMILLIGLQDGLVAGLTEDILTSPTARQIDVSSTGARESAHLDDAGLARLVDETPGLDVVFPQFGGQMGMLATSAGVELRDSPFRMDEGGAMELGEPVLVSLVGSGPEDPYLAVRYEGADFSSLGMGAIALPSTLVGGEQEVFDLEGVRCSSKLDVGVGDTIVLTLARNIGKPGGPPEVERVSVDLRVACVFEEDDSKSAYIHCDLSKAINSFKDGQAVSNESPSIHWPPYFPPLKPKYEGYLVFNKRDLDPEGLKFALRRRALQLERIEEGAGYAPEFFELIKPEKLPDLRSYWLAATNGDALDYSVSDVLDALNSQDAVVIPWNTPIPARAGDSDVLLAGFSFYRSLQWLKGFMETPKLGFRFRDGAVMRCRSADGPAEVARVEILVTGPASEADGLALSLEYQEVQSSSGPPEDAEGLGGVGHVHASTSESRELLWLPSPLLSHIERAKEGKLVFHPREARFARVGYEPTYRKLRVFVDDVLSVPDAHNRFREMGYMVSSETAAVNELQGNIDKLDRIRYWIALISVIVTLLATTQVFLDIVRQKQGVIGILRVMGTSTGGVYVIILIRAVLVGAIAVLLSGLFSVVAASMMNGVGDEFTCKLGISQMAFVWSAAFVCCVLGTLVPFLGIRKLDPLDSLSQAATQR